MPVSSAHRVVDVDDVVGEGPGVGPLLEPHVGSDHVGPVLVEEAEEGRAAGAALQPQQGRRRVAGKLVKGKRELSFVSF